MRRRAIVIDDVKWTLFPLQWRPDSVPGSCICFLLSARPMVLALAQCDLACSRESHRKLLLSLIYCLHNVLCDGWLLLPYLGRDLGASHAFIMTIQQRIDGADDTVTTIAYGFDPRTPYVGFGKRVQCGSCADSNANAGFGNRIRPPL